MIPKVDRVPEAGRANWRKHTVKESSIPAQVPVGATFTTLMEMADNATVEGTPVNRASEIELLSASGTTTGTANAMLLAQPNFTLFDGAPIRFKVHIAPAESFTLNVASTGAKAVVNAKNEPLGIGLIAGTWIPAVYSQTLDKWIVSAGGGASITDVEQGQPNFYEKNATTATLSADLKTTAVLGSGWSGTMPTFTRTSAGTGVLSFPVSIVSGRAYEIEFGAATGGVPAFDVIFASSATATTGQTIASNVILSVIKIAARATSNYTHINIVRVDAGTTTLTLSSIKYFTAVNSHSLSIKNVPVVVSGNNMFIGGGGDIALYDNRNFAIGNRALGKVSSGSFNTAVGNDALAENVYGNNSTAIGDSALQSNTSLGSNVAVGASVLKQNTSGYGNVAMGNNAMGASVTSKSCTSIGNGSLGAAVSGDSNVAAGNSAMQNATNPTGSVAVGASAAWNVATATNSVFVGYMANPLSTTTSSNETVIGASATGGGNNTVTLGNASVTQLRCQVTTITTLSDKRVKEEIQPANTDMCLDAVKRLPIHRYKYKDFTGTHVDKHVTGFLADDVEKIFPKSVSTSDKYFPVLDENGEPTYEEITDSQGNVMRVEKKFLITDVKDITMTEAIPTMWGAIQALLARVEALEGK